jgi:hypothetical protein
MLYDFKLSVYFRLSKVVSSHLSFQLRVDGNVTKVMTRTKANGEVSLNREDNVSLQHCRMHEASVGVVGVKYGMIRLW